MTTATLQKIPHATNIGRNQKYRSDDFRRSITQLADSGQVQSFLADENSIEQQRRKEKPAVYQAQLIRVRRQIKAFRQYGSIDLWPQIPAEVRP